MIMDLVKSPEKRRAVARAAASRAVTKSPPLIDIERGRAELRTADAAKAARRAAASRAATKSPLTVDTERSHAE